MFASLKMIVAGFVLAIATTPTLAQHGVPVQLLHPSGVANDAFGAAVAVSGDTMIVGAYFDEVDGIAYRGSAHVYRWNGTAWAYEAMLIAADGEEVDSFGISVAVSGDTAIIGAFFDSTTHFHGGSAYIFTRTGTTWTQQAKLLAADGGDDDFFGWSVSISGDTAIVGAHAADVGANADQGSAYIFSRPPGGITWTQQVKLTAADGEFEDFFGWSVALSGDTALVGAYVDDVGANERQGSAYVFTRSPGGTTWTQQTRLTATDGNGADGFGYSVALSGATALIGATGAGEPETGAAYVFTRPTGGTTWTQQARLMATDVAGIGGFGTSVSLAGNTAFVGSPGDDVDFRQNQGSAYLFTRLPGGTTWTQRSKLTAPDGVAEDLFGWSGAVSGDTAVVGVFQDTVGGNAQQGSVWVYSRAGSTWVAPEQTLVASDGAALDVFGTAVAADGDTTIIGARGDDGRRGSAYIFVRSAGLWTQQAKLTASDGVAGDFFGFSVAISGNTAIVGAMLDDSQRGSAYIFSRTGSVWTQQAKLTAADGVAGDEFAYAVAISGDTALIGADRDTVGSNAVQGSAYVFVRSGTTWTQQAQLTASDGAQFDSFGSSVALSGDTALVGVYFDDVGANQTQGSAYVFVRPTGGSTWSEQAHFFASDGAADDGFGYSVALLGDRALIGSYNDDIGANNYQGSAYVFARSGTSWTQQAKLIAPDGSSFDQFGFSVALSGDTVLVGANYHDIGPTQGSAYVFTRFGNIWIPLTRLRAPESEASVQFGNAVAITGDTALVGYAFDTVGANGSQGSVRTFDVPPDAFEFAYNSSLNVAHPTLAAALAASGNGDQVIATPTAWGAIGLLDTSGLTLALNSTGNARTPFTSVVTLGGLSSLSTPAGNSIDIFGQLIVPGGAAATLSADAFSLGSGGFLTAQTDSEITVNALVALLEGQTNLASGAAISFAGSLDALGPMTCSPSSSLIVLGFFTNLDALSITSGTITTPLLSNSAATEIFGLSTIIGAYANDAAATTSLNSGTLLIVGSLTNNGVIAGTICTNCAGTPPNLDVGGDLVLGSAADLAMPFVGSLVRVGGDFDGAIDDHDRYDMSLATIRMDGAGTEQTLEVMSTDIGPGPAGLDRSVAGHYPIGTLEIGPSPSGVRLVDVHDNDAQGQQACEAIYVHTLLIRPGCRLFNANCRIYYNTLDQQGLVEVPANLVPINPRCAADFNHDGTLNSGDFFDFLTAFFTSAPASDFNHDTIINSQDFFDFLAAFFAGC